MYSKFLDRIMWLFERLLMVMLGSSIIIISLQIIFRYIIGSPLNWSEQIARCIFIWISMLSLPMLMRKKGAIAFDLLIGFLPFKLREAVGLVVQLLVLFFSIFFFLYSVELCMETLGRVMAGVKMPQNIVYVSVPVSMIVLILVTFEQIVKGIKVVTGGGH